jgi:hypothetical protein
MRITWVGVPKANRRAIRKELREQFDSKVELLVCSDKGADQKARQNIRESLWAFRPSFILSHSKIGDMNHVSFAKVETGLQKIQGELCEDANEFVFALLKSFKKFWRAAIAADGRGHFLAGYDSRETEIKTGDFRAFVYRTN